jgi:Lon protease-like protein
MDDPITPAPPLTPAPTTIAQLPLFPLESVLFPGGLLPLQIFEVRYLDMIGRCHKAGTPFGVVCLSEGREVRQRAADNGPTGDAFANEAFFAVGTLARIDELQRPGPGLMMVRCTGTQRFRIERSARQKFGLWAGDVTLLDADAVVPVPDDLAFARDALRALVQDLETRIETRTETRDAQGIDQASAELPLRKPYQWNDCGWLANRWSELLPLSPALKQRFMALDSPVLRLELVADTLGQMGFALPR